MKHLFVSDVHLGGYLTPLQNQNVEDSFLAWLDMAEQENAIIYLLGDIFDFWFEYKNVIPKTYIRVLGRLKELTTKGIEIHFFKGNHDMWLQNYLRDEIGLIIHNKTEIIDIEGEKVVMGHGHDIGFKRNVSSRLLWILFSNKIIFRFASSFIHPNIMMRWGWAWSKSSKKKKKNKRSFLGEEAYITRYINNKRGYFYNSGVRRYIFGHFHTPVMYDMQDGESQMMILGDWSTTPLYGEMNDGKIALLEFNCNK